MRRWPLSANAPNRALSAAWSRSASAKTRPGEFQADPVARALRCVAASTPDLPSGGRLALEPQPRHTGDGDQGVPRLGAGGSAVEEAVHDVEHAIGQTRRGGDVRQQRRRQRRALIRLEHDRTACSQGGRERPGLREERGSPGRDRPATPAGLATASGPAGAEASAVGPHGHQVGGGAEQRGRLLVSFVAGDRPAGAQPFGAGDVAGPGAIAWRCRARGDLSAAPCSARALLQRGRAASTAWLMSAATPTSTCAYSFPVAGSAAPNVFQSELSRAPPMKWLTLSLPRFSRSRYRWKPTQGECPAPGGTERSTPGPLASYSRLPAYLPLICWVAPGRGGCGWRAATAGRPGWPPCGGVELVVGRARAAPSSVQGPGEVTEGLAPPPADLGKVTAPLPDRPRPRPRLDKLQARGVVGDLGEDLAAHGPGRDANAGNPEPGADRQATAGGAGRRGQGDELLGELPRVGGGGTTWSKNPSFSS